LNDLKKKGKYLLLSSHIPAAFEDIADQAWFLKDGHIATTYQKEDFAQLTKDIKKDLVNFRTDD
jgi:ABC-type multidrug transport system ATPase subunit